MLEQGMTLDWLDDPRLGPEAKTRLIDALSGSMKLEFCEAWDPYLASTRLLVLCRIASELGVGGGQQGCASLIAKHATFVFRTVEYDTGGNHLWRNGCALITAGALAEHYEADRWLRKGSEIIDRCLTDQVLPDGGHFERSPIYHVQTACDLMTAICARAIKGVPGDNWSCSLHRMIEWIVSLSGRHSTLPLFNDTAGFADYLATFLVTEATRIGLYQPKEGAKTSSIWLPHTGYLRADLEDFTLFADLAPPGAKTIPGHAHADLFTFELRHKEAPLIVDFGLPSAHDGSVRQYCRSWRGHNSLSVAGENPIEIWGRYRVGRWAVPFSVKYDFNELGGVLCGSHAGFSHIVGRPIHTREFAWNSECGRVVISDVVTGKGIHEITRQLRFATTDVCQISDRILEVHAGDYRIRILAESPWSLSTSEWWPTLGLSQPATLAQLHAEEPLPWRGAIEINWSRQHVDWSPQ
jgi:uncharacterized heparinase superfamily protein